MARTNCPRPEFYFTFLKEKLFKENQRIISICNGIPIRNIIQSVCGGDTSKFIRHRYTARRVVQASREEKTALSRFLPQTDVKDRVTTKVMGIATMSASHAFPRSDGTITPKNA